MAKKRVVVLNGRSLFADGTATQLEQHSKDVETIILDPSLPDIIRQLVSLCPSVATIDANDPDMHASASLPGLFRALPALRVVMLDSQTEDIQVLISESRVVGEVNDLIELMSNP